MGDVGAGAPWPAGVPLAYRNAITIGNAVSLAEAIPAASVDLVICDPVYDRIEDYAWLGSAARRLLKPGGNCLAQFSQYHAPAVLTALGMSLDYVWIVAQKHRSGHAPVYVHRVISAYKPWAWFSNGARAGEWVFDWILDSGRDKRFHKWGDSAGTMLQTLIDRLVPPGGVVFDPFTGGGTIPEACHVLGRRWIAFEIDPQKGRLAQERIASLPDPMFVTAPVQLEIGGICDG